MNERPLSPNGPAAPRGGAAGPGVLRTPGGIFSVIRYRFFLYAGLLPYLLGAAWAYGMEGTCNAKVFWLGFLGIFLSYGVFGPLAKNIDQVNAAEGHFFNAIRAGLVAFGNGAAPVTAVEFARRNIPSPERPGSQELEEVVRQIKPR